MTASANAQGLASVVVMTHTTDMFYLCPEPQYQSLQRLLDEFSAYAARAPHAYLRPKTRPQTGRSATKWWRYVGTVMRSQQQQRLTWSNIELICQLRKQYIPHYIK